MKPSLTAAALLGCALVLGPVARFAGAHGPGHNPARHHHVMTHGVPKVYRELLNPLPMTARNLTDGKWLYGENCAFCHGTTGRGDSESAADLDPAPPQLTDMYDRPMAGMGHGGPAGHLMHGTLHHHPGMTHVEAMGGLNLDAYGFWAVSEGGAPMDGSMPAFKEVLSAKERWQILLYIANDFEINEGE